MPTESSNYDYNWNRFKNSLKSNMSTMAVQKSQTLPQLTAEQATMSQTLNRHYPGNQEGRIVEVNGVKYICRGSTWYPYTQQFTATNPTSESGVATARVSTLR